MVHETSVATVNTLTASVHVLQVGSRQVTLSVYRQLDHVDIDLIEPMGRVNENRLFHHRYNQPILLHGFEVVGAHIDDGSLVRAIILDSPVPVGGVTRNGWTGCDACFNDRGHDPLRFNTWSALPLIVLAGLK